MFIVAALGFGVNLVLMKILHSGGGGHGHSHGGGGTHGHSHGSDGNINVRAAYIHALGDMLQSIGVMVREAKSRYGLVYHFQVLYFTPYLSSDCGCHHMGCPRGPRC